MVVVAVLKGVHKVKIKRPDSTVQKVYYYAWRGGPRIHAKPGTEAFALEYAEHKRAAMGLPTNTIETIVEYFTGPKDAPNPDFLKLAETTQRDHLYAFRLVLAQWPLLPIRLTQTDAMAKRVREWHRSFSINPRKADKMLFSLSKLFSYAIDNRLSGVKVNPCAGIRRLYRGSRREMIWTPADIALARQRFPVSVLNVFEAAYHTCQRQGDLLGLQWDDYDGIHLKFRQGKSRGEVRLKVRVHPRLKSIIDGMAKTSTRIFTNSRGRPWTSDGFKTSFGKVRDRAGLKGLHFHDIRGTFITERFREGWSVERIAKVSGHTRAEVSAVLDKHYIATDQEGSDAMILHMWQNRN